MNVSKKNRDLYFEYLKLNNIDLNFHLVNIDNEGYNFLVPNIYEINYAKSTGTYDGIGHLYFYNSKDSYVLDYVKEDYQTFKFYLNTLKVKINKHFFNYRQQEFYETSKNNIDTIYMYYQDYTYKISSNHKLDIKEYFDMYFILFSMTDSILHKDLKLLESLIYLRNNGIISFCNNEELLLDDLNKHSGTMHLKLSDIIVSEDEKYLTYKAKKRKAQLISHGVLINCKDNEISLQKSGEEWYVIGNFYFGCLGYYNQTMIGGYQEIINSDELALDDKKNLLTTIVKQRQAEANSYEETIKESLFQYLFQYLKGNITYSLWDKYHLREFINSNVLTDDYDVNDEELYGLLEKFLNDNESKVSKKLFNYQKIYNNTVGEKMVIYPDYYVLTLSICNDLLNSITLIIDEQYLIKY